MVFSPKRRSATPELDIQIDNTRISEATECKFLGALIDEGLNGKAHINYICVNSSKSLGILTKSRKYFNKTTLLN